MSVPWWAALRPAQGRIRCGTGQHLLRWADGELTAANHADAEGELVLAALGGDRAECVAMLEAWGAHAADLDVLALGPRSSADELAVTWELVDELRALSGPAARSVPMRPGPAPGPSSRGPGTTRARWARDPGPTRAQDRRRLARGRWRGPSGAAGPPLSPEQERARAQRVELACSRWAAPSSCASPPRSYPPGPQVPRRERRTGPAARGPP